MDFSFSDEQRMLADSVSRFVQDRYDLERRKGYLSCTTSYSAENWRTLAELGITALALPAELGGLDGTPVDVAVVMEQLGRGLVVEPIISSAVIATRILAASPAHTGIAAASAAGERRVAIAFADPPAHRSTDAEPLYHKASDNSFRLTGVKTMALQAIGSDLVIFPCAGPQGFGAFLIDPNAPEVTRKDYRLLDGTIASEFHFDIVEIPDDARLDVTLEDWIDARTWGDIAACAELLGIMDRSLDETAGHLRTRSQFGVAIGTFQSLQHRMARMLIECEKARALLYRAAMLSGEADFLAATRECRHFIGELAIKVGEECMHLHGGMGMTDEVFVSNALRRINVLRLLVALPEASHRCSQSICAG